MLGIAMAAFSASCSSGSDDPGVPAVTIADFVGSWTDGASSPYVMTISIDSSTVGLFSDVEAVKGSVTVTDGTASFETSISGTYDDGTDVLSITQNNSTEQYSRKSGTGTVGTIEGTWEYSSTYVTVSVVIDLSTETAGTYSTTIVDPSGTTLESDALSYDASTGVVLFSTQYATATLNAAKDTMTLNIIDSSDQLQLTLE